MICDISNILSFRMAEQIGFYVSSSYDKKRHFSFDCLMVISIIKFISCLRHLPNVTRFISFAGKSL